jgi:hypothetical protein
MEDNELLNKQLREAEIAVVEAERTYGPENPEVAEKLLKYASLLRQTHKRTLDAVNVEARAKAIRAKMFAAEADEQKATATPLIKPVKTGNNPTAYFGLGSMVVALLALFINAQYFVALAAISAALMVGDLVVSRGTWWRAVVSALFLLSGWWAIQSVPPIMLTNASPIDRLNYSSENSDVVAKVRNLGKPTQALIYNVCLPEGFTPVEIGKPEWGRVAAWKGPMRPTTEAPELYLMVMNPPADVKKQFRTYPTLKGAHDLVLPYFFYMLQLTEVKQNPAQFEQINGLQFVRLEYTAKTDSDIPKKGFVYVAKENNKLVALAGMDTVAFASETLEPMEASVWTLIQQGNASDLDM